jgi:hypothetical protein
VVDPVSDDGDRVVLDEVLRQAAAAGLWVGSHPDVIAKMGTTEVLYRTRGLGWGTDTDLYTSAADFARRFPARLATDGVRVVKPSRGNAGIGVWKVALLHPEAGAPVGPHSPVRLQHALVRDHSSEETTLRAFLARCQPAFAAYGGTGTLVDQAFCRRIDQGIVRCYMVGDRLVGFARQYPKGLSPEERSADPSADPPPVELIMGLPSPKTMFGPDEPAFGRLRADLENRWLPGRQQLLRIDTPSLPVLWDADFLFGPPDASGEDRFILCEINASSVMPFPAEALPALAAATPAAVLGAARRPAPGP